MGPRSSDLAEYDEDAIRSYTYEIAAVLRHRMPSVTSLEIPNSHNNDREAVFAEALAERIPQPTNQYEERAACDKSSARTLGRHRPVLMMSA